MKRLHHCLVVSALSALAVVSVSEDAAALSFTLHDDFAVVGLDARTGERMWTHYPDKLSLASLSLYPGYLHVDAEILANDGPSKSFTLALDPDTGARVAEVEQTTQPLAVSASWFKPVVLENGWSLDWKPGDDQSLVFHDSAGQTTWTLDCKGYPDFVTSWKNNVYYELSTPGDSVLHAFQAGSMTEAFAFDPTTLVGTPPDWPNDRLHFAVLGDELYVGLHQHLFRLDPATGAVQKQWDLVGLTGVPFVSTSGDWTSPQFFYGGLEMAMLTADESTLLVAFEARVIALDRVTGDLLWHVDPACRPGKPQPLVHGDLVVMTAGQALAGERPPPPPATQLDPVGCTLAAAGAAEQGRTGVWMTVALAFALGGMRRRKLAKA